MPATVATSTELNDLTLKVNVLSDGLTKLGERVTKLETATPTPSPTPTPTTVLHGLYVPLFTYPTSSTWNTLINTKNAHPGLAMRVVINPGSGVGSSKDSNYVTGINNLKGSGIKVGGYVYTSYGSRDPNVIKAEIDNYKLWYGVDGIFFDEMSNVIGKEQYYKDLTAYVKSKGMTFTIGNPGTSTLQSFVGSVDTILIYESAGYPSVSIVASRTFNGQPSNSNFGIIPYGCLSLDTNWITQVKPYCGWIYVTNDVLPNPWDSLPSYLEQLIMALQ
jgi:hypothetical protein